MASASAKAYLADNAALVPLEGAPSSSTSADNSMTICFQHLMRKCSCASPRCSWLRIKDVAPSTAISSEFESSQCSSIRCLWSHHRSLSLGDWRSASSSTQVHVAGSYIKARDSWNSSTTKSCSAADHSDLSPFKTLGFIPERSDSAGQGGRVSSFDHHRVFAMERSYYRKCRAEAGDACLFESR